MDKLRWNKIKWKIRKMYDKVSYYITIPYIRLRNYVLVKRFPFLQPQCGYNINMRRHHKDYVYRYEETWLDSLPKTWRKAFGLSLCKEIKKIIREEDLKDYTVTQVKEKFGQLEWYDTSCNQRLLNTIEHYSHLSTEICLNCGDQSKYVTIGRIAYLCPQCTKEYLKRGGLVKSIN